ncbi:MAG: chemotaxis protein CheD [Verrucomicrobia bacterium]|nr:chemotaxis protein CheD [Deltaproteobacteria bacterium]
MKDLIASHTHNIYLKPGEVVVARNPLLVSTVLGSCVAVTIFSPSRGIAAICHAMLPDCGGLTDDLRYVDTALPHIYRKVLESGAGGDLVVKLFGGAQVLDVGDYSKARRTIGEQNVTRALEILADLGLAVASADTGGFVGRKLYFCTRDGDVYIRRMRQKCAL